MAAIGIPSGSNSVTSPCSPVASRRSASCCSAAGESAGGSTFCTSLPRVMPVCSMGPPVKCHNVTVASTNRTRLATSAR